jgi:hypothetical protein
LKISALTKRLFALLSTVLLACVPAALVAQNHVVIAAIYAGGGNTSATYSYDFVELYNPTNSSIDISGYSIQYASSAGSSWNQFNFPASAHVQAHGYYLIQMAEGSTVTNKPLPVTPDYDISTIGTYVPTSGTKAGTAGFSDSGMAFTINMAVAGGKVALLSDHTTLTGSITPAIGSTLAGTTCPSTATSTTIVDFVGWGSATCSEGGTTAPVPASTPATVTNTASVVRNAIGADTDVNGTDFTVLTPPTVQNSSGAAPVAMLGISSITVAPSSVTAGSATPVVLTVVVTPGATSTGIAVTADLSGFGGSATQPLTLTGTANTWTYSQAVPGGAPANTYTIPIKVTDQESGSASGSASLVVVAPVTTTPIATLQGNRSTYVGTTIQTTGVVTTLLYNGFFIQTPSANPGSTGVAEGINVFTSSAPTVHVGDIVTVTGKAQLFPTPSVTPALEIASPAVTVNSSGNALPAPIALTAANLTPNGGLQQLTKYEGMRVSFASLTSISGTDGGSLDEVNEIYKSNGRFFATITGTPRPFREPGIDVRDPAAATAASTIPRFDDNPERILVDTFVGLNTTPMDVSSGATFTNVTGVLDFTFSNDSFYDPSRFIPDIPTLTAGYTPGMTVTAMALPAAGQFTVGAFNIERFFNTNSADNLDFYPVTGKVETSQAVTVTPAAYARRLTKVSLAIRHVLNNPDILALEEAENGSVLKDIAAQISADAITAGETDPKYVAYGTDNSTIYSNDFSGISTGFLVKSTVDFIALDQFFNKSTFTPTGGNLTTTDDRPPFVLHAGIKRGTGTKDYPITVIVNHMKALPDDTVAVQQKKELQAEELAGLIQGYQAKGEHVLAVGDFNAFEFSDGYIDALGTVTNRTVPANTVIQPGKPDLVTPPLTDLALNVDAAKRYSYVEDGSAQILDHVVATADLVPTTTLVYGRVNADFPVASYNDATTAARVSDHDPALAYLALPAPVVGGTLTGTSSFPSVTIGASSAGQAFTVSNTGEAPITITTIAATGDFAQSNNCGTSLAVGSTCAINVVFTPTAAGSRTGTLTITSNGNIAPASLTGTGVATPTFTLTDTSGTATTTITVAAGTSATGTLKFTSTNGFAGSIAVSCAAPAATPTGATCSVTSPVTLAAAGTATATVTINTTARTTVSGFGALPQNGRTLYALLVVLLTGVVFIMRNTGRKARVGSLLTLLFVAALGVTGCGDSSKLNTSPNANGTPSGTYNYTITATSGGVIRTETVIVIVQ